MSQPTSAKDLSLGDRILEAIQRTGEPAIGVKMLWNSFVTGFETYCEIPPAYTGAEFRCVQLGLAGAKSLEDLERLSTLASTEHAGWIVDPVDIHLEMLALGTMILSGDRSVCTDGDPFLPKFGVIALGKPGTGKTHMLAALALRLKALHDEKVKGLLRPVITLFVQTFKKHEKDLFVDPESDRFTKRYAIDEGDVAMAEKSGGGVTNPASLLEASKQLKSSEVVQGAAGHQAAFKREIEDLLRRMRGLRYQPGDLVWIEFDKLCGEFKRDPDAALNFFVEAKMLFLDDMHPGRLNDNTEEAMCIDRLIRGRYDAGRKGMFITSNFKPEDLARTPELAARLQSRIGGSFYVMDFKEAVDWRTTVHGRLIELIRQEVLVRVATLREQFPHPPSCTVESGESPNTGASQT